LNKIKLVGLDLDGTITQHKTKLEEKNKRVLQEICRKYKAVIVAAGACQRVFEQLNRFKINIIGNYGMQEAEVIESAGSNQIKLVKDITVHKNRAEITDKIERLRKMTGYLGYQGDTVEFHQSGAITFPLLGTKAKLEDKLSFDPNRLKRREIYHLVKNEFSDDTVFIGGTSSFDIVPKEFNKYTALMNYAEKYGVKENEIVYFGDDYGLGGNDEHVYQSKIKFVKVDDYLMLKECVEALIC